MIQTLKAPAYPPTALRGKIQLPRPIRRNCSATLRNHQRQLSMSCLNCFRLKLVELSGNRRKLETYSTSIPSKCMRNLHRYFTVTDKWHEHVQQHALRLVKCFQIKQNKRNMCKRSHLGKIMEYLNISKLCPKLSLFSLITHGHPGLQRHAVEVDQVSARQPMHCFPQ